MCENKFTFMCLSVCLKLIQLTNLHTKINVQLTSTEAVIMPEHIAPVSEILKLPPIKSADKL